MQIEKSMDKKTICIFTIHAYNYGAVLQACALRLFCEKTIKDSDVRIVGFYRECHSRIFRRQSERPLINLALNVLSAFRYGALKRRLRRESRFIRKYGKLSVHYDSPEALLKNPPPADCYITGSDQVFNSNSVCPQLFYLGFPTGCSARKIAYAPSFGFSVFSEEFIAGISGYLKDFSALSCRETSGAELLSRISGRIVPTVVDPTMLLDRDEWDAMAADPGYNRKYILVYDLNGAERLIRMAKEIQWSTGLPIVCLTGKVQKFYPVDKQVYDAGPAEFVGWIKNAEYVVTDSFHGSVFSLIFHRRFYTYVALERAAERLTTLLGSLGISDRLVRDGDTGINLSRYVDRDYQSAMNDLIRHSKAYLVNAIMGCNE